MMILGHPATLGVIAWLIVTIGLIVAFAGRGISAAWSISSGLVRGVRQWSDRAEPDRSSVSPRAMELPALPDASRAVAGRAGRVINAGAAAQWRAPAAEIEDLPDRHVD